MALYLGNSERQKVILDGNTFYLNLYSTTPIINGIRLLSSDNYILKGSNELYLIPKDSPYQSVMLDGIPLLSSERYFLNDLNELYMTIKEDE